MVQLLLIVIILATTVFPGIVTIFGLKIIDSAMTKDQNGYIHLIGEAKNDGTNAIDNIYAIGTLLNNDNSQIGNFSNQLEVHPLKRGEVSPFDITIYDKSNNNNIHNYKIKFTSNSTSTNILKDLSIGSVKSRLDLTGLYFISGRITNNMNAISNGTLIIASVKDKNDNLLGIWRAQSEPYNIPPLSSASFTIPITDESQSFKISNYTLYINTL